MRSGIFDVPGATAVAPVVQDYTADPAVSGSADGGIKAGTEDADAKRTMLFAVGTIAGSLVLLWLFGGIVFRDATL